MACCDAPLLGQLQNVMTELAGLSSNIGGSGAPCCKRPCCPAPVCVECPPPPHPICCMPCPPPLVLPTLPEPVKPLMMPVEKCEECAAKKAAAAKEKEKNKNDVEGNFYNNYNVDYRKETLWKHTIPIKKYVKTQDLQKGVTLSGQPACCCCANNSCGGNKRTKQETGTDNKGSPTGNNKPYMFQLTPSPDCSGAWCVEIKPLPEDKKNKTKKSANRNEIKPCSKPCCKHWKPKEGECQYDLPCKAACFNHPPGMKPKHHVPAIDYELLKVLGEE